MDGRARRKKKRCDVGIWLIQHGAVLLVSRRKIWNKRKRKGKGTDRKLGMRDVARH
jgi:hypothetical protein